VSVLANGIEMLFASALVSLVDSAVVVVISLLSYFHGDQIMLAYSNCKEIMHYKLSLCCFLLFAKGGRLSIELIMLWQLYSDRTHLAECL